MTKLKAKDGYDSVFGDFTEYTDGEKAVRWYDNGGVEPQWQNVAVPNMGLRKVKEKWEKEWASELLE